MLRKTNFTKRKKQVNKQIIQNKIILCEKAEELVNIEANWKDKTDQANKLQGQWKKSGYLPKSQSDKLWNRFRIAMDGFYECKKNFFKELDKEKNINLVKKEKFLKRIQKFKLSEDKKVNLNSLNDFQKEWRSLGEGNGGIIFPDSHYGRDSIVGIALFLSLLAEKKMKCSELRASYPNFFMSKNKIQLTPEIDVDMIFSAISKKYAKEDVTTIDGVKIDFAEEWVHLRKSNTEPIIRIYTESVSKENANNLAERFMNEIKELTIN